MKGFFVFVVPIVILSFVVVDSAVGANCELRDRTQRIARELPVIEDLKGQAQDKQVPSSRSLQQRKRSATQSAPVKRPARQTLPQLAKNLEIFLQKIIPNHSLVQDLLGYVTMKNPNGRNVYSTD